MLNQLSAADQRRFQILQTFRAAFAALTLILLAQFIETGTSTVLAIISAVFGVIVAGQLLRGGRSRLELAAIHVGIFALATALIALGRWIVPATLNDPSWDFAISILRDHIVLLGLCYAIACFGTALYWTVRSLPTWETVFAVFALLGLFAGHRNYQLDAPAKVSELAFSLHLEPQHFLMIIAVVIFVMTAFYLFLSEARPVFTDKTPVLFQPGRGGRAISFGTLTLFGLAMLFFVRFIDSRYAADLSRASEGVGQASEEGNSPLGFHSAVGKTKQPAALIRLESDYQQNPIAPMLYLREGALSQYNGHEFVIASQQFDADAPRIAPGSSLTIPIPDKANIGERVSITQSVYLLSQHQTVFAIDRPESIRSIRNPDPERFNTAYQALSLAPAFPIQAILNRSVGSKGWSQATWDHYLRTPGSLSRSEREMKGDTSLSNQTSFDEPVKDKFREDLRYEIFARQLTEQYPTLLQKAAGLIEYLSEESIYTRAPGHKVTAGGDPVAPYLFADKKRGYCVHFAHAAVYMLRALGIPSRIGTGYLTDLTYAKDGHILLHIGDRHAWPEIYVDGIGWFVIDIVPAQAENEQALVPDEQLLDELMAKLDPAEQFVPPEIVAQTSTPERSQLPDLMTKRNAIGFGAIAILIWALLKTFFRRGYRLYRSPRRRARLLYASAMSALFDLGVVRRRGETRRDFAARAHSELGVDILPATELQESLAFRTYRTAVNFDKNALDQISKDLHQSFSVSVPVWKRFIAFLNTRSLTRWGRW